jgi:tetratricopeptide (TPR) repeat protein
MLPHQGSRFVTGLAAMSVVALCVTRTFAQTGHIAGEVKDADTGKPIKGATVVAENAEAIPSSFSSATDAKGRFSMIGMRGGLWIFTASAPGYEAERGASRVQTMSANGSLLFALRKHAEAYVSPLAGADPKAVLRDLASAEELADRGQWDAALAAFEEIRSKLPALTLIEFEIGRVQRAKGDFAAAAASFQKLLDADPQNKQARVELGATELARGNLDEAARLLESAADVPGESRDLYFALGELTAAKAQPGEAAAYFRKAIALDPGFAKAHLRLGTLAANQGDAQVARTELQKAIEIDPDAPEAAEARKVMTQLK